MTAQIRTVRRLFLLRTYAFGRTTRARVAIDTKGAHRSQNARSQSARNFRSSPLATPVADDPKTKYRNQNAPIPPAWNFRLAALVTSAAFAVTTFAAPANARKASSPQRFRLVPAASTVAGKTREQLLIAGYSAKVMAEKDALTTKQCDLRPQFGSGTDAVKLSKQVFTLPAELGKSLTCEMNAKSMLLIDHIGVICNDGKNRQASVECIEKRFAPVKDFRVIVDGVDLGAGRYRVITEKFVVDLPKDSPFGLHEGKWQLRAGGWPIVLADLSPGEHSIETSYKLGKGSRQRARVTLTVSP
jgi:hypothetical protein